MRHIILLSSFGLFLLSCGNNKKETTTKTTDTVVNTDNTRIAKDSPIVTVNNDPEQMVADIRKEYQRITGLQLVQKKYPFECSEDPANGAAIYYTENGKVVRIHVDWGVAGDYFTSTDYYFKNDKLIFILEIVTGGPAMGPDKTTEERTYVNNDITIKHMNDQKITPCTTCKYDATSKEYKMLNAFNTNNVSKVLCEF